MRLSISKPINKVQEEFNRLCELGGGARGGPAASKVRELLSSSGRRANAFAFSATKEHLAENAGANPWYVCFAIGLSWGHLAKFEVDFTSAVVRLLTDWNAEDLSTATSFYMERGPEPIEHSLRGAHNLFTKVKLPPALPNNLKQLASAQDRWFSPILGPDRPRYIGSWNSSAMFMSALFAQPKLARSHHSPPPLLPPGGPIYTGLDLLFRGGLVSTAPDGTDLDDAAFEPGALYVNNNLLAEFRKGIDDCGMVDIHSGIYLLGTRHPHSALWI